jgi:hypothetical protein
MAGISTDTGSERRSQGRWGRLREREGEGEAVGEAVREREGEAVREREGEAVREREGKAVGEALEEGAMTPAAAGEGCGACAWEVAATPTLAIPAVIRRTPATPASRAPGWRGTVGGRAYPFCGQEHTTRNPAIRRHSISPNRAVPPSARPRVFYQPNIPTVNRPFPRCRFLMPRPGNNAAIGRTSRR